MKSEYDYPEEALVPKDQRVSRSIELSDPPNELDFQDIFGNSDPVELEIGFGKGLFLLHSGYQNPGTNFLGVEYARKYFLSACDRIEKRPIHNVRLIHGEAMEVLTHAIPDGSLQKIHLYFPDPWPKKRHHKRRLFQMPFLEIAHRKLKTDAHLFLATDHAGYWEWMQEILQNQSLFKRTEDLPQPPGPEHTGLTNYHLKYQKEGREINRAVYQRVSPLSN